MDHGLSYLPYVLKAYLLLKKKTQDLQHYFLELPNISLDYPLDEKEPILGVSYFSIIIQCTINIITFESLMKFSF